MNNNWPNLPTDVILRNCASWWRLTTKLCTTCHFPLFKIFGPDNPITTYERCPQCHENFFAPEHCRAFFRSAERALDELATRIDTRTMKINPTKDNRQL